jgi:hypothetical protein
MGPTRGCTNATTRIPTDLVASREQIITRLLAFTGV